MFCVMERDQHLVCEESEPKRDDKSVTSQVLDYYQRYSQNRELPKYFCGTSAINLEDWHQAAESSNRPIVVTVTSQPNDEVLHSVPLTEKEIPKIVLENPSPSSSITSNRKLEWDNGADIGYSNSNMHKSISLPVLTDLEFEKLRNKLIGCNADRDKDKVTKLVETENSKTVEPKLVDFSSTSESIKSSRKSYFTSTPSSSYSLDRDLISDSESGKARRLKFLKAKVGLPIAESTPLIDNLEYCVTPCLNRVESNSKTVSDDVNCEKRNGEFDLKMVDKISRYKNMKILKLSVCKPVVVECAGPTEPVHGKNKLIQTSLPLNISIGIQTDFDFSDCRFLKPNLKVSERQSVFYVCYSDSDRDVSTGHCSTAHTQTNSAELSNCNSFQYFDKNSQELNVINESNNIKTAMMERFLASNGLPSSDLTSARAESEKNPVSLSKSKKSRAQSPLTLLQSQNQRGNIKELQKTIELLQKLMQSKKYDAPTKKFYLKKMMKKIVDSKSESSGSTQPHSEISEAASKFTSNSECNSNTDFNLIGNSTKANRASNLSTHTFIDEILPTCNDSIPGVNKKRLQRSPLLTLTNPDIDAATVTPSDLYDSVPVTTNTKRNHSHTSNSSSSAKLNPKTWRDDKTRSEKILDLEIGDFDRHKVDFAKKERHNQLYWINNEISHLGKLKKLLESPKKIKTAPDDKLHQLIQKPHVEDMKGIKKQTTVYVLSTEKENFLDKSRSSSKSSKLCACNCNCPQLLLQSKLPIYTNEALVQIGTEQINLQQGHLVASEEFTSKTDDAKCTTTVRRYTFEIPIEGDDEANTVEFATKASSVSTNKLNGLTNELVSSNEVQTTDEQLPPQLLRRTSANQTQTDDGKITNVKDFSNQYGEVPSSWPQTQANTERLPQQLRASSANQTETVEGKRKKSDGTNTAPQKMHVNVEILSPEFTRNAANQTQLGDGKRNNAKTLSNKSSGTDETTTSNVVSTQSSSKNSKVLLILNDELANKIYPQKLSHNLIGELVLTDEIASTTVTPNEENDRRRIEEKLDKLSNELVLSDNIPSTIDEKAPDKICTCAPKTCECKESASTLSTSSESATSLCCCCKEQPALNMVQTQTVDPEYDTDKYMLCYPCYYYHQTACYGTTPYLYEGYVCKCYKNYSPPASTLKQLKKTIQQLENLESETKICQCTCIETVSNSDVCVRCNCRINPRYRRRKGGLAYAVTVEADENYDRNQKENMMESLQEIKIKVPPNRISKTKTDKGISTKNKKEDRATSPAVSKKTKRTCIIFNRKEEKATRSPAQERLSKSPSPKQKNKMEHKQTKTSNASTDCKQCGCCCCDKGKKHAKEKKSKNTESSNASSVRECSCKNKSRGKRRHDKREENDNEYMEEIKIRVPTHQETLNERGSSSSENETNDTLCSCCKPSKIKKGGPSTLQEYLSENKPGFIVMAEQRRQCLLDLTAMREERCRRYKKKPNSNVFKEFKIQQPFSSQEMKQMTAKNYKKCREVQEKLEDVRERELKRANKLLYDVFNKKLQDQVLKGRHTLPINANVVSLR